MIRSPLLKHLSITSAVLAIRLLWNVFLSVEGKDEKKRLDHLKQDQEILVIKIFSERKKVFGERKKCEKIHTKRSDFLQGIEQYL
ncbi:hypothetical protein Tco_0714185 [Tanacetum coccineum]